MGQLFTLKFVAGELHTLTPTLEKCCAFIHTFIPFTVAYLSFILSTTTIHSKMAWCANLKTVHLHILSLNVFSIKI